jgi:serine/threonine/tyrosine-interacting protein
MDPSNPLHVPAVDWRYELRREAQEILKGLFVGPYQSSRNLEYMHSLGLTHVLCIQDAREAYALAARPQTRELKWRNAAIW